MKPRLPSTSTLCFWETWWFLLAMGLACIACIAALYRMRLRQMTARIDMRFQERLAERTRIAQELHDTLLQGFSQRLDAGACRGRPACPRIPSSSRRSPGRWN